MKTLFFAPRWGHAGEPWDQFCQRVVDQGYDGVETSLPYGNQTEAEAIVREIQGHGLSWIGQHWEVRATEPDQHEAEFLSRLEFLFDFEPLFVNSQTGKDWYTFEQNARLIRQATELGKRWRISLFHETHRGKALFHPQISRHFLEADPEFRLTADFSHWCCASESLLEDQGPALDLAISRSAHIHARVGFPEGPQVPDFRSPEWKTALDRHLGWWDQIRTLHQAQAAKSLTVTCEFGPFPYLVAQPFGGPNLADQDDLNRGLMELLRKRWS